MPLDFIISKKRYGLFFSFIKHSYTDSDQRSEEVNSSITSSDGSRPSSTEKRLSNLRQKAWMVETRIRGIFSRILTNKSGFSLSRIERTLSFISAAASSVNVMASIFSIGGPLGDKLIYRRAIFSVFPEPAGDEMITLFVISRYFSIFFNSLDSLHS